MPPRSFPMPSPRRQSPENVVGSGALSVAGLAPDQGGVGQVLLDGRPEGFWAQIVGQPNPQSNAYAFVMIDDGAPDTPTQVSGAAAIFGDGVSLAAFERSGSLSVPTDGSAIVWLEPLRLSVGYGFVSSGGSSIVSGFNSLITPYFFTSTNVLEDTGLTVTLPAAGSYLVTGWVQTEASASALSGGAGGTPINFQINPGPAAFGSLLNLQVANQSYSIYTAIVCNPIDVNAPTAVTLFADRAVTGGAVWGDAVILAGTLIYLKIK